MKDRELDLDNGWVSQNPTNRKLHSLGYSIGGYIDKGVYRYVLYRADGVKFERVHEFNTEDELQRTVKLLIPPEG